MSPSASRPSRPIVSGARTADARLLARAVADSTRVRAEERISAAASSRERPAMSVSQTSASMPSVARIASASRRSSASAIVAQWRQRILDPADRPAGAAAARRGSPAVRATGAASRAVRPRGRGLWRAMARSRAPGARRGPAGARRRATTVRRARGSWRAAAPAGWGSNGRRWCARPLPARRPARPSASTPSASSSRVASTIAIRVRAFWLVRPVSSYGIDMLIMVP